MGYAWGKSWLYLCMVWTHSISFLWILYHAIKFHVVSGVVKSGEHEKKHNMANYAIDSCASSNRFYLDTISNIMIINEISAVGKDFVLFLSTKVITVDILHLYISCFLLADLISCTFTRVQATLMTADILTAGMTGKLQNKHQMLYR